LRIINGDATIYSRSTHILAISTNANAISGKNSAIATSDLMIKIPEVPDAEVILVSVSWAKLSSEEYIVTSGQTNHLDFWIRLEIVKESVPLKKRFPVTNADSHDQI